MLLPVDYYRMEVVTVDCPACGSVRGEPCKGKNVKYYHGSGHTDRKNRFRKWAKYNPEAYEALRDQIERQAALAVEPRTNELYMGEN